MQHDATGSTASPGSNPDRGSLEPSPAAFRRARARLSLRGELLLAALPTAVVLLVLALVDRLSQQRLLFASLASSAFLIYLDPEHGMNRLRALVSAQLLAAVIGWTGYYFVGGGFVSAAVALVATILLMIVADIVHPPAVGTAMAFALRAGDVSNVALFLVAVGMTAILVVLQRLAVWFLARARGEPRPFWPAISKR
ncbi:MAG TPA: HPP family protein [Gemmatimonadaceae bacterium]|nr:HPP family protein [Gemmatimonadaceae bacterium]